MWEINSNLQIATFLYSLILGVIFEIFYDVFRAMRKILSHKNIAVFIEDVVYFLVISLITFLFLLGFTNGEVRAYILFGIGVGFYLFYKLFSRYILCFLTFITKWIFKVFSLILKAYKRSFSKIYEIIAVFLENSTVFWKKVLKNTARMVYTNKK